MPVDDSHDTRPPAIFGLLAVCALALGVALLVVVQKAGDSADRTLPTVAGLVSVGLGIIFAAAAAVEQARR